MKPILILVEENKETENVFVRGQTTDENKAFDWALENARKQKQFIQTPTGFATHKSRFDVIDKDDLK